MSRSDISKERGKLLREIKEIDRQIKNCRKEIGHSLNPLSCQKYFIPALGIIGIGLLIAFVVFTTLTPTGFIAVTREFNYSDDIGLTFNKSSEYMWVMGNYGSLKSVRLDGSISTRGSAKAYLVHENESYLLFDSSGSGLRKGANKATALVVGEKRDDDLINKHSKGNQSDGGDSDKGDEEGRGKPEDTDKEMDQKTDKKITIKAEGGGRKDIREIFVFNTTSLFSWIVEHNRVCTEYSVNNVSVCYGAEDCCALLGLETSGRWNDSFYLSYGRYSSGLKNIIKVRLIYANYSLDIENPYSEIIYSEPVELEAEFYDKHDNLQTGFEDACEDTCLLPGFNSSSYKLLFIIEDASLSIDSIRYSVEKEINLPETPPELIREFGNITVYKNEEFVINLSSYFKDEDGDALSYSYYKTDNITIETADALASIIPDKGFTGSRYVFFRASDGYYNVSSNVFRVLVTDKPSGFNKFVIKDSYGESVASINDNGNMYIKGELKEEQNFLSPPPKSLIIRNASDDIIAYINNSGSVFLRGKLVEYSPMDGSLPRFEIRNVSDEPVAFFDSTGDLRLKGRLAKNHGSP